MGSRRAFFLLAAATLVVAGTATVIPFVASSSFGTAAAQQAPGTVAPIYTGIVKGVAVGGYDPVAYFTEKKPVKGNPSLTFEHEGAQWHFSSEANRDAFKKEPAKYMPQYGGYCAWAVAQGYTAHGDPQHWTLHEGKLYLNYNRSIRTNWEKDIPGFLSKSEVNWPRMVAKAPADGKDSAGKEPAAKDAEKSEPAKAGGEKKDGEKAEPEKKQGS